MHNSFTTVNNTNSSSEKRKYLVNAGEVTCYVGQAGGAVAGRKDG